MGVDNLIRRLLTSTLLLRAAKAVSTGWPALVRPVKAAARLIQLSCRMEEEKTGEVSAPTCKQVATRTRSALRLRGVLCAGRCMHGTL